MLPGVRMFREYIYNKNIFSKYMDPYRCYGYRCQWKRSKLLLLLATPMTSEVTGSELDDAT